MQFLFPPLHYYQRYITQHVEMHFFYIFTSCVVSYPTVKKYHFRKHLIWDFHENHIPFSHFCRFRYMYWVIWVTRSALNTVPFYSSFSDAHANPRNIWVGPPGDTENHYETRFWWAVDFSNLKCISFIKCRWILDDLSLRTIIFFP